MKSYRFPLENSLISSKIAGNLLEKLLFPLREFADFVEYCLKSYRFPLENSLISSNIAGNLLKKLLFPLREFTDFV